MWWKKLTSSGGLNDGSMWPTRGRERQVRVRLDQAGHDRRAGAVDHLVARLGYGSAAGPHGFHAGRP